MEKSFRWPQRRWTAAALQRGKERTELHSDGKREKEEEEEEKGKRQ